jgi:hypothetical protein
MDRRNFIRFLTFTPPASAAIANELVAKRGGEIGIAFDPASLERVIDPCSNEIVDRRDNALYDVMRIPAGTLVPERWPFFQSPVGYNLPGTFSFKGWADTNMEGPGYLHPPQDHITKRILFLMSLGMSETDRNSLAMQYAWEFRILQKVIARAPLGRCVSIGHPKEMFENWGEFPRRNRAVVADQFCVNFKNSRYLPPLCNFSVEFRGKPFVASLDIELYVLLDGISNFPVQ